jgi:hypothetical protein
MRNRREDSSLGRASSVILANLRYTAPEQVTTLVCAHPLPRHKVTALSILLYLKGRLYPEFESNMSILTSPTRAFIGEDPSNGARLFGGPIQKQMLSVMQCLSPITPI